MGGISRPPALGGITMRTALLLTVLLLFATVAVAEDGEKFVKNISKTPDDETSFSTMKMLGMYVIPQDYL